MTQRRKSYLVWNNKKNLLKIFRVPFINRDFLIDKCA